MKCQGSQNEQLLHNQSSRTGECLQTLYTPHPYDGMNITGATGLTEAEKATLKALGVVEVETIRAREIAECQYIQEIV